MTAEVGDVVHVATAPVVLGVLVVGRQGGGHQQLFRAQGVADGLVLGTGADAVANVDRLVQVRTIDDRVVGLVADDLTVEQVDVADEFTHQAAGRGLVDVHRAAGLGDPAQVHDGDALGHGHGLFLIMGDHHAGHADALDDFHQFQLHLRTQFLVQRAHRLVEQQQFRTLGQ